MRTMHAANAIELSRIQLKIEIEREGGGERHLDIDFATRCTSCSSSSNFACPFLMRVEQKSSWPPRQIGITANRQIALIFALRSGKRRSFFLPRKLLHNVRALVSDDFHLGKSQSDASLIRRVRRTVECNFCDMCATLFLTSIKKLLL